MKKTISLSIVILVLLTANLSFARGGKGYGKKMSSNTGNFSNSSYQNSGQQKHQFKHQYKGQNKNNSNQQRNGSGAMFGDGTNPKPQNGTGFGVSNITN